MDMGEVTRQELDARLESMKLWIEAKFAESDAKNDARFREAEAKNDARFREAEAKNDARFRETEAKNDAQFRETEARAEARFETADAKAEVRLERIITEFAKWIIGTAIALFAVILATMALLSANYRVSPPPQPVVINIPGPGSATPTLPAQASPPATNR